MANTPLFKDSKDNPQPLLTESFEQFFEKLLSFETALPPGYLILLLLPELLILPIYITFFPVPMVFIAPPVSPEAFGMVGIEAPSEGVLPSVT